MAGPFLTVAMTLALLAGVGGAAQAQTAATPNAAVDPARTASAYPNLLVVRGAASLPVRAADGPARRRAAIAFSGAVAYAAAEDSNALLVWQAGRVVLAKHFAPYTPASRTWSASMAKTLVAMTLGVAIRDGFIQSVDEPVSKYLAEWRDDAHHATTFRNLLEMASGLDHPLLGTPTAAALAKADDMVASGLALPQVSRAGSTFDYNTINVVILMEAIHRAVGTPFDAYLSKTLWQPLGASDAMLNADKHGHSIPALFALADDWLRVGILIEQRGRWQGRQLVPAAWIAQMVTPTPTNANYGWLTWLGSPPGTTRSYGPYVGFQARHSEPFLAKDMVYLDGFSGQRVYVVGSQKLVIVRTGATRIDWDDAILPNMIARGLHP